MRKINRGQKILNTFLEEVVREKKNSEDVEDNSEKLSKYMKNKKQLDEVFRPSNDDSPSRQLEKERMDMELNKRHSPYNVGRKRPIGKEWDEPEDDEDDDYEEENGPQVPAKEYSSPEDRQKSQQKYCQDCGKKLEKNGKKAFCPDCQGGPNEETQMNEATFSRQHYLAIAKVLNRVVAEDVKKSHNTSIGRVSDGLVEVFKKENPSFDEDEFLDAIWKDIEEA